MTLAQILERQAAIRSRLAEIEATPEPAADADEAVRAAFSALPTETDALLTEWDTLEADRGPLAARAAKLDAVRSASHVPANVERAFHAPQIMKRTVDTAFDDPQAVRSGRISGADLLSRAQAAVADGDAPGVDDVARNAAIKLLDGRRKDTVLQKMAILTGSPAYRSAFETILEHPGDFHARFTPEESEAYRAGADLHRAALSETNANGGYAIPFLLDPTVVLTNAGAASPFREAATIKQGTSNAWHGINSAGVTAEWKSEGAAAADASPTIAQPVINAYLADAFVFGSYEVFGDTNLAGELPMLIADAKNRLEAAGFVTGSGSAQPYGVITRTTAITASRVSATTGGTFGTASAVDVFNTEAAVPARFRPKASFVANWATYTIIRQQSPLAAGSNFWVTMSDGMPDKLLSHRAYEATAMASTITTGSNILLCGDLSQYYIYDRIGMNLEYIPNMFDTSTGRPTGQRGWMAWWRVGGDVISTGAEAFRVLKL